MNHKYEESINQWNQIFSKETSNSPIKTSTGNEALDKGIGWVCEGTESVLDFGCGNGSLLLMCASKGTKKHVGIDLSESGIQSAMKRTEQFSQGNFEFIHGSISELDKFEDFTFDAFILSNIIDNLFPEDAEKLMYSVDRILKKTGKVFIKLNPYLSQSQIEAWDIKIIKDNVLDDGFILWNNTTEQWRVFFENRFCITHFEDIYFPEHDQYNRMFLLTRKI